MALYSIVSILVAVVMSCINITILSKYKILRKDSIFIVSLASIVISVSFPLILSGFLTAGTSMSFGVILITTIITCLSLLIVTSALVVYWENNKEKGKMPNWSMSNIIEGLRSVGCLIESVIGKKVGIQWRKQLEAPGGVKNIKGRFVDTGKNTDTIGLEDIDDDIFLFDRDMTIQQSNNNNSDSNPWDKDNSDAQITIDEPDADMDLEGYGLDSNCDDYFDEEVLKESLNFENEYESEILKGDEQLDESVFDPIFYLDEAIDPDIEELIKQSDFPYLNSDIGTNWNEVASHRDDGIGDNEGIGGGTHNIVQNKALDEIIDEGFKLKKQGDYEGAIINFLYALDNRPANDVAHLIVLDICVMYKQLGQVELAKKVLNSYIKEYGIVMDEALKYEIELNLQ